MCVHDASSWNGQVGSRLGRSVEIKSNTSALFLVLALCLLTSMLGCK